MKEKFCFHLVFFELKWDFFYFSNPHLTKYLYLKTQNQPPMRDETSTITLDEAKVVRAEANKSSVC